MQRKLDQVATGYGLIEGPIWDPARGLYFSDVLNGGVHLLDRTGNLSLAVPKRRGIGGMALHADGGLVVGGRDIAWVSLSASGDMRSLLALEKIPGATGFNDLTPIEPAGSTSARLPSASSAAIRPSPGISTSSISMERCARSPTASC